MLGKSVGRPFSRRAGYAGAVALAVLVCLAASIPVLAQVAPIKPYKDDLFQNHVISTLYGGDMRFVEYSKQRDLYGRDQVVEKKAYEKYVSLEPSALQHDLVLPGRGVRYIAVGRTDRPAHFIVIFLHGGGNGSREQAVDDWSFGGNFNRLKNLVVRNDGLYLSPDFNGFGGEGRDDIEALMTTYGVKSPGVPVIVACTSLSGWLCFDLMADKRSADRLGGILLLGSLVEEKQFLTSPVFVDRKLYVPIFIGHGSKDSILDWVTQETFFKKVKGAAPDYPIRFDVFVNGLHGTPMRLVDWRRVLNWMLGERAARTSANAVP